MPRFQARHYNAIAEVFSSGLYADAKRTNDLFLVTALDAVLDALAEHFARDNARFSSERFRNAAKGR